MKMKITITDPEVLRSVSIENIVSYLNANDWVHAGEWRNTADSYIKEKYHLLVPNSRHYTDYARRVQEILETISLSEKTDQLTVYNKITGIKAEY